MTPATLFDIPSIHNEDTCSRNRVQAAILEQLRLRGPLTTYELRAKLTWVGIHVALNSVGSRLNELRKKGLVEPTGEKRPGRSGRPLTVWRRVEG